MGDSGDITQRFPASEAWAHASRNEADFRLR